jgi:hypothetical protein
MDWKAFIKRIQGTSPLVAGRLFLADEDVELNDSAKPGEKVIVIYAARHGEGKTLSRYTLRHVT